MQKRYDKEPLANAEIYAPDWLDYRDPLWRVFKDESLLLQEGKVVFAHIVQANVNLFKFFSRRDFPAQIVYSTDPLVAEHPDILANMARKLFSYKNKPEETVPEEYREIAKGITSEYDRSSYTIYTEHNGQTIEIRCIPVLIFRNLLPLRKLCGSFLPVLASPNSKTVLILPKRYWTGRFASAWSLGLI